MSNDAAVGFMVLAAKILDLDKDLLAKLMAEMLYQMDIHTNTEAERCVNNVYL